MSHAPIQSRIDRLYDLLPVVYRMRDAEQGYPLQALLRVIAEQANAVEDDIAQLYENWFVETAEPWVLPYIGDLIGYHRTSRAGPVPRREIANTIRHRRRKGTLAVLELLARDVAGWSARAVEFFKLLAWTQNINHPHPERARTLDIRSMEALQLIDGPFDRSAHSVDVRRINSRRTRGRHNILSVGVFVWRLVPYSVTRTPAHCAESVGPNCFTFSVLGQDAPLFIAPRPETDPAHIAGELNLPGLIRLPAFAQRPLDYYGEAASFVIWPDEWAGLEPGTPVPASAIIPSDLSGWQYVPPAGHVAVDPVLGRFVFPPSQAPRKGVRVSYRYGFSADMGGGEYRRTLSQPAGATLYRVGEGEAHARIADALLAWEQDAPADAVIEFTESAVYVEPIDIHIAPERSLQLRAVSGARPVIRLLDWQTDLPDALTVTMEQGSRFTLDGLLITGRGVHVKGPETPAAGDPAVPICASRLVVRHCTLVPGWSLDSDCVPSRPTEPSLELFNVRARVQIEHSIVGSIQVNEDEVRSDAIPIQISDSIVDAASPRSEAVGAPGEPVAHAVLTVLRSTVFGIVEVHAVELAQDSIFNDCVNVARRQVGCMRFCYVPPGCRTPRRYRCQDDGVVQAVKETVADPARRAALIACERLRVRPQYTSTRYGLPGYGQLAHTCAVEISEGAEDGPEMGAFHDLFQPQRRKSLQERLDEFTPAGMDVGIIYAT